MKDWLEFREGYLTLSEHIFTSNYILMLSISEMKQQFSTLTYNKKRAKVLAFLKELKTNDNIIEDTIKVIEKHEDISEKFLEDTYYDLLDFADLIAKNKEEKAEQKLKNISKRLKDIADREKKDRETEHADDILKRL